MGEGLGLPITKLVATGNDFVFIDARMPLPSFADALTRSELARRICDRHFGVGADGLVFVEQGLQNSFRWDFFNSDGSVAEMCGNATRCMGRWAQTQLGLDSIRFETVAGPVTAHARANEIVSDLPFVQATLRPFEFEVDGRRKTAYLVNTGVPHAVVDIDRLEEASTRDAEIRALRFHPETGPRGANVTFLERVSERSFKTVTFERGVEDFTLSCGTGVLAAAAVGLSTAKGAAGNREAEVGTPGGELHVLYGEGFRGVSLEGPAKLVFTGRLNPEFFK